jgi:hypothetical protein
VFGCNADGKRGWVVVVVVVVVVGDVEVEDIGDVEAVEIQTGVVVVVVVVVVVAAVVVVEPAKVSADLEVEVNGIVAVVVDGWEVDDDSD